MPSTRLFLLKTSNLKLTMKKFLTNFPELKWAFGALILWAAMGLLLEPFTATYGLSFLHKMTITLCRIALAISFSELVLRLAFPTIWGWQKQEGVFLEHWNAKTLTPEEKHRLTLCVTANIAIFVAVLIALSL